MSTSMEDVVGRLGAFQHIEREKAVEEFVQMAKGGAHTRVDSDGPFPRLWIPSSVFYRRKAPNRACHR